MNRPSAVLISIDSLRYDCVPGAPGRTHLDAAQVRALPPLEGLERIARGAFHFTECIASAPYTTVSHATLFTGLLPTQHGVRRFFESSLRPDARSLAETLRDAGYATCLVSDRPELLRSVGLGRGFDMVADDERQALSWWDRATGGARLLVVHFFDVHQPYGFVRTADPLSDNRAWREELEERVRGAGLRLPERPADLEWDVESLFRYGRHLAMRLGDAGGYRSALELYLAGLERFDRLRFRQFVAELARRGILDHSVVVVCSDHGEGRDVGGRHALAHAGLLLDDVMRTPLFVRVPGRPGRTISEQVGLMDVTPTILDLVGATPPAALPAHPLAGRSLAALCEGHSLPDRPIYGEVWHCVRTRDVPFVELSKEEVSASQYALRQRMVRWPDRKFCVIGQPVRYDSTWRKLSPEHFTRRLYRDVLGRIEDPDGFGSVLRRMHSIAGLWRGRVFRRFLQSSEFQAVPKFARYDLVRDPLESDPIRLDERSNGWREFQEVLATLAELDALELPGEPLLLADQETAVVGRLQDLGYFE